MYKLVRNWWISGLLILGLIALYFLLRLPNLTLQPIFADEAIYIRWAQIMKSEPTLRFISLTDGKTPLFMWMMTGMFKFIKDPLLAGRMLSVIFGCLGMLGVVVLGWQFFNRRVGLLAGFLAVIAPMTLFFDRMALVDSTLAAFGIWSLVLALFLARKPTFREASILGYLLGAALLVKTPAMFNFISLPTTILFPGLLFSKNKYYRLKVLAGWVLAFGIAMVMYNALRLGPGFVSLSARNQDYIHPLSRLIDYPFDPLIPHLRDMMDWFPNMLTWPIFLLSLIGIVFALVKRNWIAIIVVLWAVIPFLIKCEFLKTFTARYILEAILPMIILAAFAMDSLIVLLARKKQLVGLVVGLLVVTPLAVQYDWLLTHSPEKAPLPREERRGYFEDWTAGYGLSEMAQFFQQQAAEKPIVVGTSGAFGTLPDGLWIYLDKEQDIVILPGGNQPTEQLYAAAKKSPTYFVANRNRFISVPSSLRLIREYPKAVGPELPADAMVVYEVLPENVQK